LRTAGLGITAAVEAALGLPQQGLSDGEDEVAVALLPTAVGLLADATGVATVSS
jgi:hypothetical protein